MKEKGEQGKKKFFSKKVIFVLIVGFIILAGGTGIGVIKATDNPKLCAVCHNMDSYYDSYAEKGLLANKHAEEGVTCHDCHTEPLSESVHKGVKYVTGDYEDPLEKRDFGTREFCTECHAFDEVKETTDFAEGNPHSSHNGDQECSTCHSMHQPSEVMCQECHTFEWMDELDESWK